MRSFLPTANQCCMNTSQPPLKASEECLERLDGCHVYAVIVGQKEGARVGSLTITHMEYQRAKKGGLPVLAFIKGERHVSREDGASALLEEIESDGRSQRFGNVVDLQREVRGSLVQLLESRLASRQAAMRIRLQSRRSLPHLFSNLGRWTTYAGRTSITT